MAVSLVAGDDHLLLRDIEKKTKLTLKRFKVAESDEDTFELVALTDEELNERRFVPKSKPKSGKGGGERRNAAKRSGGGARNRARGKRKEGGNNGRGQGPAKTKAASGAKPANKRRPKRRKPQSAKRTS